MSDKLKTLSLKVSESEHKQIKRLSVDTGKPVKDLMMECLQRLIREYEAAQSGESSKPEGGKDE